MSALDPAIHAPARLQLCAILSAVDEAQFATLRDELGVSDSVLSKHLAALSELGYVRLRKELLGKHRATWVSLTPVGRRAFNGHVAALRALIDVADAAPAREAPAAE
ncbi:MAG: transcriptional regulator [Solirubrobacteraceae bacterium]|nr:transcriptional regulator [Patulibacter sp.]